MRKSWSDRGDQGGQTLIVFALMMVFVFVGLMALVGDSAVLMFEYNRATSAALIGAQAGASDVDLAALYGSNTRQLAADAADVCRNAAMQGQIATSNATCSVTGGTVVTATVTREARLPIPVFGVSVTVKAVRSARTVFGGATPQ